MELRNRAAEIFDRKKEGLLIFAVLLGFGFYINQGVELKGLYMDDLYLWSCYGEQTFTEFVFPIGGTRFRFVFYIAAWLEMFLLNGQVELMVPFNIVLNALIACSIYKIAVRMSNGRKIVSFLVAIAYLTSRFSYYQIGQFYGLMESLGLWTAIGVLYYTWRYGMERHAGAFGGACACYFAASFIHERYMVLVPVLLIGILIAPRKKALVDMTVEEGERTEARRSQRRGDASQSRSRRNRSQRDSQMDIPKWALLLITIALFVLIQIIRLNTIGTLSPAGTGGTDVEDTFVMEEALQNAWAQVDFVFGKNSGPDYLCVMTYEDSPKEIQGLIGKANLALGLSIAAFAVGCVLEAREDWKALFGHLKTLLLFLAFIALCIGASSVTIRVEMRWIYVVYAAALLLLAYMSSKMHAAAILIPIYVVLMFQTETFYRSHWDNLYYMPNQLRYNSLAEVTYGTYGEEIFEKQVYIIGNTYELSEFTAETFLKVYDRDGKAKNTTLQFIDSDFDFKTIPEDAVILWEDADHNAYLDVTAFVKQQRLNYAYGSYEDGWVDEHSKIVLMNGNEDVLKIGCYYPGTVTGNEVVQIKVNGERMPDLVFTNQYMTYEIPSAPYEMISLEFSCNFYVEDALEQRGEERLSMVVTLGAK